MTSELEEIQNWYESQCDEDWEHQFGVRIDTLDNPGWSLEIDVAETSLAHRQFLRVEIRTSEREWLVCEVSEGKFRSFGGPHMLGRMLRAFLDWARAAHEESGPPTV